MIMYFLFPPGFVNELAKCSSTFWLNFLPISPDEHGLSIVEGVLQMSDAMEACRCNGNPLDAERVCRRPEELLLPLGSRYIG